MRSGLEVGPGGVVLDGAAGQGRAGPDVDLVHALPVPRVGQAVEEAHVARPLLFGHVALTQAVAQAGHGSACTAADVGSFLRMIVQPPSM